MNRRPFTRRLSPAPLELLECRVPFAADFHNSFNPFDVSDDGLVTPLDALLAIQELNARGPRDLQADGPSEHGMVDVSNDGQLSPLDALMVLNHLNAVGTASVPLVANLAPESDPDGNGVVLRADVTLKGQTVPHARIKLIADDANVLATADSQGRFSAEINVPPGASTVRIVVADPQYRGGSVERTIVVGDVILNWNATLLNVVRDWTTNSNDPYPNRIVTSQPPMVARNLAMVHAAMYDAINLIEGTFETFHVNLPGPDGASSVAAAAAAAHRVASQLYQEADERALFDAALSESLATVSDEVAKGQGVALGQEVGDAVLAWRVNDGASAQVNYISGSDPGDWNRTFPDYFPPQLPQWPHVTPFTMVSGDQFRPPAPPDLTSEEYAAAVNELIAIGGLNSQVRTAEQTEIALFWADGGGTFTPPGHWNQIAAEVSLAQGRSLAENARTFAMLNFALADAGIACWDAKYTYGLWRPINAIRQAALDGNEHTQPDVTWQPLIRTPPFPTYTSGHSTFSGAAEVVLTYLLGENVSFQSTMDGQNGFSQRPLSSEQIIVRSFSSFAHAAEEASHSRVYGGIHFEFDSSAGLAVGRAIGEWIVTQYLREG